MAPRGLSAEEKRVKLLEIFHETKDFYQLKELEKLGPKLKGIVSQSVKDVLQSLVDDGLVQADKIGSSNFFWSFPSQHGVLVQARLDAVTDIRRTHQNQIEETKAAIEFAKSERNESDARTKALKKLNDVKKELSILEAELNAYGDSNPARVEEVKRAAFLAKEATHRWTDNYSILLGYFTKQTGVGVEDVRQYLGIPEDYEDLE
ncbi:meiotic nuclear division protein 1 [Agrocybe pediades]|nr:meiotic nuclear division protein 1 [Agrocybe pediades]